MSEDKQNKNIAEAEPAKRYLIAGAVILVVLTTLIFSILKREKFSLPDSFKMPLYKKTRVMSVSPNAKNTREIIFLAKASFDELSKFYEDWAKKDGFVFVNTGLSERKQVSAGAENASAGFTLTPMIDRTDLFTYFFVLKPQGDGTEVKISYDFFLREKQNNADKAAEKIKLPKDFKLKL